MKKGITMWKIKYSTNKMKVEKINQLGNHNSPKLEEFNIGSLYSE